MISAIGLGSYATVAAEFTDAPSKALIGVTPGKKLVGIVGIGMLAVVAKPEAKSPARVVPI